MILVLDDDEDFCTVEVRYRNKTYSATVDVEREEKSVYAQNKNGINLMRFPRYEYNFKIKGVEL